MIDKRPKVLIFFLKRKQGIRGLLKTVLAFSINADIALFSALRFTLLLSDIIVGLFEAGKVGATVIPAAFKNIPERRS
jgi:hypothetical protein